MVVVAHIYSGPGVVRNTGNTITDLILTKTNELGTIIIPILYLRKLRQERVSHLAKVRYPSSAGGGGIHTQVRIQILCS